VWQVYLKGLGLGAGLIVAIGSQNAHVLRMGLRRQHVGLTVLVCILCETALISLGVAGIGKLVQSNATFLNIARWGGAAFLCWYGLRAWRAAFKSQSLSASPAGPTISANQALAAVLAVTLLNPHVYLDTVVLLGAVGGQQGETGKWWFALGAVSNAVIWFAGLGYGAGLLSPWFAKPSAWRWLDTMVGVVMLVLAASLAFY
jgi:L-lysine exporter family protein LysE/ArgO